MSGLCGASHVDLHALDAFSRRDSPIHRLDPRAKLVTTLVFAATVASVHKYAVLDLLPFLLFPLALWAASGLPARIILNRLLAAAPFAVMVGAWNPLLDPAIILRVGPIAISGGWASFFSISLRLMLAVGALVLLIGATGAPALALAAEKLGAPAPFVSQILNLYRYLFVLLDETQRTLTAYRLRAPGGKPPSARVFARIVGHLLLRALARAERIHHAMLCRGFNGRLPRFIVMRFTRNDWLFTIGWCAAFAVMRFLHPAALLGRAAFRLL